MEKLKPDNSINMGKIARVQSLVSGAGLLISGVKQIKNSPKTSLAKSIFGGYLIYRGLTGHCLFNQLIERSAEKL